MPASPANAPGGMGCKPERVDRNTTTRKERKGSSCPKMAYARPRRLQYTDGLLPLNEKKHTLRPPVRRYTRHAAEYLVAGSLSSSGSRGPATGRTARKGLMHGKMERGVRREAQQEEHGGQQTLKMEGGETATKCRLH